MAEGLSWYAHCALYLPVWGCNIYRSGQPLLQWVRRLIDAAGKVPFAKYIPGGALFFQGLILGGLGEGKFVPNSGNRLD
jgi:hypothetical protein